MVRVGQAASRSAKPRSTGTSSSSRPRSALTASTSTGSRARAARSGAPSGSTSSANPSTVIRPWGSRIEASSWTRVHSGLGATPPQLPECSDRLAPLARSSKLAIPLTPNTSRQPPAGSTGPSLHTTRSAASSWRWPAAKAARLGEPISSSPSSSTLTVHGSSPLVASRLSTARSWARCWPLLSAPPRPYRRPSRTSGSNGGLVQASRGSGGCTS
jgi:hypothetical protein